MSIITNEGKAWDASRVQNKELPAGALHTYLTWGTGTTAEATMQTASPAFTSFTESAEARTTGVLTLPTTTTDRCVGTITATAARTITQVARTNVLTVGAANQTMLLYALFTAIPLATGDQITFTLDQLIS